MIILTIHRRRSALRDRTEDRLRVPIRVQNRAERFGAEIRCGRRLRFPLHGRLQVGSWSQTEDVPCDAYDPSKLVAEFVPLPAAPVRDLASEVTGLLNTPRYSWHGVHTDPGLRENIGEPLLPFMASEDPPFGRKPKADCCEAEAAESRENSGDSRRDSVLAGRVCEKDKANGEAGHGENQENER